ncbi:MAG: anti-sigma factor [Betaproteobacteria bacterium]
MNALPITEADVHAYVDGTLASSRVPALEAAAAHDPVLAARIAAAQRHNTQLRDAFDTWLTEPVPERLIAATAAPRAQVAPAVATLRNVPSWARMALASAAVLVLGIGIGWFGRDFELHREGTPTSFTRQAALVHALYASDVNRPVEIWAAEEKRLVNWLTKRLGFQVRAPDLNALGFALVGGRLVAGNEMPTALFVYENADKQRLTLQVRRPVVPGGETAFRYAHEDGVGVFYWIEENCTYALSGNLDRARLLAIGHAVYGQLAALEAGPK